MKSILRFIFNFQTIDKYIKVEHKWYHSILWHSGRAVRNITVIALVALTAYATALVYNEYHPKTVYAEKTIEVVGEAPVLKRILVCESNNKHLNKFGQVLIKGNVNGSYDIGKYQINSVWNAQATKLGLDLTKEKDNEEMAKWIYANRGTEDWYSSKDCWQK